MLNNPDHTLIIYGSLAPGQINHHQIEHIQGVWQKGHIFGKLVDVGWGASLGYKGYIKTEQQDSVKIEVHVFFSEHLPNYWKNLDEFEGKEYQRELIEYILLDGTKGIGNIYSVINVQI